MRPSALSTIRPAFRLAALGAVALSVSACSQADRFAYDPFTNPFNGKETTGSVSSAPAGGVSSQPLPPPGGYQASSYTAPAYAPQPTYPQNQQPYRQAAYTPPQAPQRMAPPAPLPQYQHSQGAGWSSQNGKTITVQSGDTAYALGARYGVPASAILQANNLPAGAQLTAGQRIVIPGYHGPDRQAASAPKPAAPARQAETPRPAASGNVHTVKSGETLFSIARTYDVHPREIADVNNVDLNYHVRIGERMNIPGGGRIQPAVHRTAEPARVEAPVYRQDNTAQAAVAQPQRQDDNSRDIKPTPVVATASMGGTDFRWPVRGRIISDFGQKPNGQANDGINISVPEGTEIRAAEGGVVAYAGNQLKGFGNLVLIRHANEWVTAYAHASEILVKRGDVVRRGQTIAKAGKTGNVSAPQLHFEVRRGASPVDPLNHLPQG